MKKTNNIKFLRPFRAPEPFLALRGMPPTLHSKSAVRLGRNDRTLRSQDKLKNPKFKCWDFGHLACSTGKGYGTSAIRPAAWAKGMGLWPCGPLRRQRVWDFGHLARCLGKGYWTSAIWPAPWAKGMGPRPFGPLHGQRVWDFGHVARSGQRVWDLGHSARCMGKGYGTLAM